MCLEERTATGSVAADQKWGFLKLILVANSLRQHCRGPGCPSPRRSRTSSRPLPSNPCKARLSTRGWLGLCGGDAGQQQLPALCRAGGKPLALRDQGRQNQGRVKSRLFTALPMDGRLRSPVRGKGKGRGVATARWRRRTAKAAEAHPVC